MKKLAILICCIAFGYVAKAQRIDGDVCVLLNESRVNFELNFSKATIHGMSEAAFAKYEQDWYKDMPEIIGDFIDDLNDEIRGLARFGYYPKSKYKLKVDVIEIATNGQFESDVYIIDDLNNCVAKITGLVAYGSVFGTKLHRIKSGSSRSGEELGELLFKTITNSNLSKANHIENR